MISPQFRTAPVSLSLVGWLFVTYLIGWFQMGKSVFAPLMLDTRMLGAKPWTLLTYGFVQDYGPFLFFLLGLLWIWSFCSSVEIDLGPKRFLAFFAGYVLLGGLCVWAGSTVAGLPIVLSGPLIAATAITVAWCARHPQAQVRLMMILPITGRWLALIVAAMTLFAYPPMVGIFAVIPAALAWLWGSDRLPIPYGARRNVWDQRIDAKTLAREEEKKQRLRDEAFQRQKEREERERLRKLFEESVKEDDNGRS